MSVDAEPALDVLEEGPLRHVLMHLLLAGGEQPIADLDLDLPDLVRERGAPRVDLHPPRLLVPRFSRFVGHRSLLHGRLREPAYHARFSTHEDGRSAAISEKTRADEEGARWRAATRAREASRRAFAARRQSEFGEGLQSVNNKVHPRCDFFHGAHAADPPRRRRRRGGQLPRPSTTRGLGGRAPQQSAAARPIVRRTWRMPCEGGSVAPRTSTATPSSNPSNPRGQGTPARALRPACRTRSQPTDRLGALLAVASPPMVALKQFGLALCRLPWVLDVSSGAPRDERPAGAVDAPPRAQSTSPAGSPP